MSWECLISGLLAGWIMDKHEQKKKAAMLSPAKSAVSPVSGVVTERQFINTRNKTLIAYYQAIPASWFDDPEGEHDILATSLISGEDKVKLRYYYSRLEATPNSCECRTALIHYLYKSWVEHDQICLLSLLQNELLYLIDYMHPITQQERMYQHLAMFLSAECYFFNGEFAKALKRLYQALDWEEIYDNVAEKDGIDFNGLGKFHEAAVANIINLYALADLPDKADQARKAFSRVINENRSSYASMLADATNGSDFREYVRDSSAALMARDTIQGFYTLSLFYHRENIFKESCTSVIRGQVIYSIDCEFYQPKDIWMGEAKGLYEKVFDIYPALFIRGRGTVINYQDALARDRAELMTI